MADDTFDAQLQEIIKAQVTEQLKAGGASATPGQTVSGSDAPGTGVKLTVGGQEYSYESPEAASQAVQTAFQNYETALAAVKAQAAGSSAEKTPTATTNSDLTSRFVEHVEKKDIKGAIGAVLNEALFDGKAGDPYAVLKEVAMKAASTERVQAAQEFKQLHPEFPASPQSAQVIEQVRNTLGLGYTVDGLEAAYAYALGKGFIKPMTQDNTQDPRQTQQNGGYQANRSTPPPSPGRAAMANNSGMNFQTDADWINFAESQDVDKLGDILETAHRQGLR